MKKLWGGVRKMVYLPQCTKIKIVLVKILTMTKRNDQLWYLIQSVLEERGDSKITRGTGVASLFLFKDTITNFGIIISVVLIQFVSTQSRFQSPRYPCPAERAMTLHWTRVTQTLVTRLVLTLRIRRHRSHSPLYLPLGFCSALCPKKLY